jgi:hypothetical protein
MTYRVDSDALELRRGSFFTTLPIAVEAGQMGLFDLNGFLLSGRWCPNFEGSNWILIPGHRIRLMGEVQVRIVGKIIPAEEPPEEMGELTETERKAALKIARSLK